MKIAVTPAMPSFHLVISLTALRFPAGGGPENEESIACGRSG
jgi:hypothetical protein